MKLLTSPTSPYGRKVRIVLLERGVEHAVNNPWAPDSDVALSQHNPLGKVPALLLDDGTTLFDSVVIAEYVATLGAGPTLIPEPPLERALVRRWEAVADGIMDATVLAMLEGRRPEQLRSAEVVDKQVGKVRAALGMANDALADAEFLHGRAFSLADAALCSALGYLDLRLTSEPWRERFPHVARYEKALATRPSVSATAPPR